MQSEFEIVQQVSKKKYCTFAIATLMTILCPSQEEILHQEGIQSY